MEVKRRNYSIGNIVLFLTIGGVFTALGISLLAITFDGVIKYGIAVIGAGIIMPIILILALLGFGITALVMGGKQIYLWIRGSITLKRGKDATAKIVGHKSASFGKNANTRKRYALVLSYNNGEENKTFTTDYLFDINEFRYLSRLECIKVKIDGNFISVCEPFPKDIYKVDSTYGIELAFYKQKPVAILLRLWVV
ncbi:MAG: hypothetical protein K2M36_05575, partial [Clostridia bacterium]|nr:hypothetical protein [Clostridia bacterium]